jgi:hypothetical protein
MLIPWVAEEMRTVDLGDIGLYKRLREVLGQLAAPRTASIPAVAGGFAEMMAAYRLFENRRVHFDNVLCCQSCCQGLTAAAGRRGALGKPRAQPWPF